jgi:hypothetical protein
VKRSVTLVVSASLALSACGGSDPTDSAPAVTPAPSPAPGTDPGVAPEPSAAPPAPTDVSQPTEERPAEPTDTPAGEEPAPEPAMTWPDDGCSADNSPTPAAAAEGPPPAIALRPESAASPLPDLAVRRINCKGGWENLRNELPADRPLLVWFWAPH